MYTIKQAARLTGVPEGSLRAWERRYGIVAPRRTDSGYRIYDNEAVAAISRMRQLIDAGWSPAQAAQAIRDGSVPAPNSSAGFATPAVASPADHQAHAADYMERFLAAAAAMDPEGIEENLDRGFSIGSFEHVVDSWLLPTLEALGEGWARGEIDVAGEHAASHAVHRRLAAAFEAAGSRSRGAAVVVGLPPGSQHELGALAFATAIRRRGLDVLYLGANVPENSWETAVTRHAARGAVMAVVTAVDRPVAIATAESLRANHPDLLVASGGAFGEHLAEGVRTLSPSIRAAAEEMELLLHADVPSMA